MATGVVVGVGLLITVLSFFILLLSIFLMLQKNLSGSRPVDARLYACAGGTALSVAGAGAEPVGAGVRRAGGRLGAVEIPPDGTNAR